MFHAISSRLFSVSNPREVWLITAAHGVNEFYSVALPPILPLLVNDFAISYAEAGTLLTVFFATYSVFQLPVGMLADRIGQRWILSAGMVVLAAGILAAANARSYETLVAAQALTGVGGSTYHPTGMSLISDLETGSTEGKAMGIHGLGGVVGTALAPVLVGGLAALFDRRVALTVSATVGVAYAAVFLAMFRDVNRTTGATAGASKEDEEGGDGSGSRWSNLAAFASIPRERWVGVVFLINLSIATQIGAVRSFATSYFVEYAGMTAAAANGIFFVMLVGAGVSSLGAGTLADAVDRRTLGFGAMVVSTLALAASAVIPVVEVALLVWAFLLGVTIWAALPALNAITARYSEAEFSGSLFGVMLTAGSVGGAAGPLLTGLATDRFGMGAAFPMVAGVSAVGAVAFLAVRRL